jgi:osmotically inducible protein OsmC
MAISKASAVWEGSFREGKGAMRPANGPEVAYSAGTRFEGVKGSNPEELIGAAHAGCFSMALAVGLGQAGAQPTRITTNAKVHLEKDGTGFTIKTIELDCEASASGIDDAKFQEVAEATKKGCPVSKLLAAAEIRLTATLVAS